MLFGPPDKHGLFEYPEFQTVKTDPNIMGHAIIDERVLRQKNRMYRLYKENPLEF